MVTSPVDKPSIIVSESDFTRLTRLAQSASGAQLDVAEELLTELDRAQVIPDEQTRSDFVQMGSTVTYDTDAGHTRTVTVVYPGEADIERSLISIMTPIGAALLGLSPGQSIGWVGRDNSKHTLTVTRVEKVAIPEIGF